jgi:hypothetical protein
MRLPACLSRTEIMVRLGCPSGSAPYSSTMLPRLVCSCRAHEGA